MNRELLEQFLDLYADLRNDRDAYRKERDDLKRRGARGQSEIDEAELRMESAYLRAERAEAESDRLRAKYEAPRIEGPK